MALPISSVFALATTTSSITILPLQTSKYYLGTTSPSTLSWKGVITDQLCLTADTCRTTWPTGGSGGGSGNIATSTSETSGFWPYWTSTNATPATLGATSSPFFTTFGFGLATGTSATTTNHFSTTSSSTNLFAQLIKGAGLTTCNGSTSGLSWAVGIFGCATITPAASSITGGAALTKVDDTNVTLTLGGSPSTSLLSATSLTLGWTGTLADSRVADNLTISGGTVDNSVIGGTTPAAGNFTTLLATSSTTLQNFTGLNSTTTNATTTTLSTGTASTTKLFLSGTGYAATSCLQVGTNGAVTATGVACGSSSGGGNSKFATTSGSFLALTPNGGTTVGVGIGTTTPAWALQIASSTRPQLALSDGTLTSDHWTFRSIGGNLYLATSSPTTFATSTTETFSLNTNGQVLFRDGSAVSPTLAFSDDTNNGIFSPANDIFAIATNGLERFRIDDSSAYSGFGTTSPKWLLNLATSTRSQLALSTGIAGDDSLSFRWNGDGGQLDIASSSDSTFATSTTPALSLNTNAPPQLGIATGTPGTALPAMVNIASSTWSLSAPQILLDPTTVVTPTYNGSLWHDLTQKTVTGYLSGINQNFTGTLYTVKAQNVIANTTTETSVLGTSNTSGVGTTTLPANFWVAGKTVQIHIGGLYGTKTITPGNLTIKVKWGSTVLASETLNALASSASKAGWDGDVMVTCLSVSANNCTFSVAGHILYAVANPAATNLQPIYGDINNSGDTTSAAINASNRLDVTATWATADVANIATTTAAIVNVHN